VCRIRERAADSSWELVEHEIDLGWYRPRIRYVLPRRHRRDQSIAFGR
jgi:hypothetical protein